MATYILLSRLTDEGRKTLKARPERLSEVNKEIEVMGGRVTAQYALLGTEDFLTVVDVPAPLDAFKLSVADRGAEAAVRTIAPAMDLGLFIRLIGQTTETVGPHRWQITVPARTVRSVVQWHYYGAP